MKVALLSGGSTIHTIRWANALVQAGVDVYLFTQHELIEPVDKRVKIYLFPNRPGFGYFFIAPKIKKILKKINPDIVNAHYASGYGTTARLIGYAPTLTSVWGSDVYLFPYKSLLHRWWLVGNLQKADAVASTGVKMAEQVERLVKLDRDIYITPFGVDVGSFAKVPVLRAKAEDESLIIGTVKSLAHVYGIDVLLKTFALIKNDSLFMDLLARKVRLRIVGTGAQEEALKNLSRSLGLEDTVDFVGRVSHDKVIEELAAMDVFAVLSRSESFGVAAVEAAAAGLPVVATNVGGLPEVVVDGQTGILVGNEDTQAAAEAMKLLLLDSSLRLRMGDKGREFVFSKFAWPACVEKMISVYRAVIDNCQSRKKI